VRCLIAALACLLLGAGSGPIGLELKLQRSSFDLLDSLDIALVVRNAAPAAQTLQFSEPAEYAITIQRDGTTLWGTPTPPPGVAFSAHRRSFAPGLTTLVVYAWNELARGGWSPMPGSYTLRARLLCDGVQPEASARVVFVPPLPTSALAALPAGDEATFAGKLDATRERLSDASGSISLTRRLALAPVGKTIVVRGAVSVRSDGSRSLEVERWVLLGPPGE
jgi:hypothetical protein